MKEFEIDEPRHYYCITYFGNRGGNQVYTNVYSAHTVKQISKGLLDRVSKQYELDNAVVMAISYMGYMTEEEFKSDE